MVNTNKKIFEEIPLTFGIYLTENDDRLDCAWYNPEFDNKLDRLKSQKNDRRLVKLRTIADINGGKRLPKGTVINENDQEGIPYVRAGDVKNLRVNIEDAIRISKNLHQQIQNYQLIKDDIVITIVGAKIGEVGILDKEVEVCDFTENVGRVRIIDDGVLPEYLLYFLDSEFGQMQTERFTVGSLQFKLSLQSCKNVQIYLPFKNEKYDLEKQKKLLFPIFSLLSKVQSHRNNIKTLITEANSVVTKILGIPLPDKSEYLQTFNVGLDSDPKSRLDALYNHPVRKKHLSLITKYPSRLLGKLTQQVKDSGIAPSDYYRLVELEQVDDETGQIIGFQEVFDLGSDKILLKKDNLIVSKMQPEKGKVALVDSSFDGCVGSSEFIQLSLDSDEVTLEYLWAILKSPYILQQWKFELTGSSRMRIGPNELGTTIIPVPEITVQEEIVGTINSKMKQINEEKNKAEFLIFEAKNTFQELIL